MYRFVHAARRLLCLAFFALPMSCFANLEPADSDAPRWACWYAAANLSVQCLLSQTPRDGLTLRAAEVASTIDRRLPRLVSLIWGSPEKLAGYRVSIPLLSQPFEMDYVRQLAKSVMCGGRRDCSVHFDANADGQAQVRAAAIESGASEVEVMAEMRVQGLQLSEVAEATPGPRPAKRPRGSLAG
ncbi:MAG: hypothetical protein D3M94_12470 [Rhodocyclales bacterium GT-UBC]|nr:MAG: hypothetical protein D3M94_12470 [Rhodocyclales bacterium GT-UBC]